VLYVFKKFPIGLSCARLAKIFAVPEVEIWLCLYWVGMVVPGDQCFCIEIVDFTQCVVARKKIILHWLNSVHVWRRFRIFVVPEVERWHRVLSKDLVLPGDSRMYRKIKILKGRFRAVGLQKFPLVQAVHV